MMPRVKMQSFVALLGLMVLAGCASEVAKKPEAHSSASTTPRGQKPSQKSAQAPRQGGARGQYGTVQAPRRRGGRRIAGESSRRALRDIQYGKQDLRRHGDQNAGGDVLVVMSADDMAHFARQYESQRRIVEIEPPHAAINHHRAAGTGGGPGIGLVCDNELEARETQVQIGVQTIGDIGQAASERKNSPIEGPVCRTFRLAA